MKKTTLPSLLLIALFLLPGCFGGGEDTPEAPPTEVLTFYRLVDSDEFSIQVPEDWETITTFTSAYPENTIVAFRNNVQDHTFIANLNVIRNSVEEGTTTEDYALEMFETVSDQVVNFEKITEEEFTLYVGDVAEETYIYEFVGSNDTTTEPRHFMQLYGVSGTNGYIVTSTYDDGDTELAIDQINQSIRTFMLK